MRFDLLFFPDGCFTRVAEAYICVAPRGGYNEPDPRAGYLSLTSESISEEECNAQIDDLISELEKLKAKEGVKSVVENVEGQVGRAVEKAKEVVGK